MYKAPLDSWGSGHFGWNLSNSPTSAFRCGTWSDEPNFPLWKGCYHFPVSQEKMNERKDLCRSLSPLSTIYRGLCGYFWNVFKCFYEFIMESMFLSLHQGFILKLILLCFALLCTLSHSECNVSQECQSVPFFLLMWGCRQEGACQEGSCEHRTCWIRLGSCWTCGKEKLPHHQLHACVPWPAFLGLCSGYSPSLPALLLGINTEVCQSHSLLFARYFESLTLRAQETNRTLIKISCTHCMLKVCWRKVKRFCFLCVI